MVHRDFVNADSFTEGDRIAIYGFGSRGVDFHDELAQDNPGVEVCFYLDTFKSGECRGKPVYKFAETPEDLLASVKIVIASHFWPDIKQQLAPLEGLDVYVYDPSAVGREKYFHLIGEMHDLGQRIDIRDFEPSLVTGQRALHVFHRDATFVPLNLPGTVSERYVDHLSGDSVREALAAVNGDDILLCPRTPSDIRFYHAMLEKADDASRVYINRPVKAYVSAFVMEDVKAIYLPVPKCASTSILTLLQAHFDGARSSHRPVDTRSSMTVLDVDEVAWDEYFTFTFVRSPLSRLASLFRGHYQQAKENLYAILCRKYDVPELGFADFVDFVHGCPDHFAEVHFRSQHTFLARPDGTLCPEFVGYLETFNDDWARVSKRLGLPPGLGRKNASGLNRRNVDDYYTPELRTRVLERYRKDVELLFGEGLPESG